MREWTVAGGLIESPQGILLVRNRRRNDRLDWSPPGGVIDDSDDGVIAGLTREVLEETGITVTDWDGPVYEVSAEARDLGWHLRAVVFVARAYEGDVIAADPDGIVDKAAFVDVRDCPEYLERCHPWVREPLGEWIDERWDATDYREYRYAVHGTELAALRVERQV